MNKEWSELQKNVQQELRKENTFSEGINELLILRKKLLQEILNYREILDIKDFSEIPFINAKGYHSKTIAYSLFHIFRIEDIVVHSLIQKDEQIFFRGNYKNKMNSTVITTGNELVKLQIQEFSKQLNIGELYNYILEVNESSSKFLKDLDYNSMKLKMTENDKLQLRKLKNVSEDENAVWLIDYWCGKDVRGLINMPLSRHWIMHIEACSRIITKLRKSK